MADPLISDIDNRVKNFAIFMPLAATSLAVTYDIGYFSGLGLRYFSFFSLSEHMVFALQALPFAAILTAAIVGYPLGLWMGRKNGELLAQEFLDGLKYLSPDKRKELVDKKLLELNLYSDKIKSKEWIPRTITVVIVGFSLGIRAYATALAALVVSLAFFGYDKHLQKLLTRSVQLGLGAILAILLAFALGYERASAILAIKDATDLIQLDSENVSANIIRGGERGLLIAQPSDGKIRFLRWEAVKGIISR